MFNVLLICPHYSVILSFLSGYKISQACVVILLLQPNNQLDYFKWRVVFGNKNLGCVFAVWMSQSYQWTEPGNSCMLINLSLSVSLQNSKFTLISQILIQKHRVLDVSSSTSVTPFSYLYARPFACSPFLNPFRLQHPMLVPSLQYLQLGAPKSYRFQKT